MKYKIIKSNSIEENKLGSIAVQNLFFDEYFGSGRVS